MFHKAENNCHLGEEILTEKNINNYWELLLFFLLSAPKAKILQSRQKIMFVARVHMGLYSPFQLRALLTGQCAVEGRNSPADTSVTYSQT